MLHGIAHLLLKLEEPTIENLNNLLKYDDYKVVKNPRFTRECNSKVDNADCHALRPNGECTLNKYCIHQII